MLKDTGGDRDKLTSVTQFKPHLPSSIKNRYLSVFKARQNIYPTCERLNSFPCLLLKKSGVMIFSKLKDSLWLNAVCISPVSGFVNLYIHINKILFYTSEPSLMLPEPIDRADDIS